MRSPNAERRLLPARGRAYLAVAAVLALVAAGCSDDDPKAEAEQTTTSEVATTTTAATTTSAESTTTIAPTTTTTTTIIGALPAPEGDAFYIPPDPLPPGEPGDIIWASPVDAPDGNLGWRMLYRSTTVKGGPVAVSGLLYAPEPLPGTEPMPILAAAHGTTGLGDQCAPSRLLETEENSVETTSLPASVRSKYVITATDYEGLGTPGVHPYVVGISEAHSVLDSIRAAQRFPGVGTSEASKSVAWGHSQGGGAALLTAELAPTYAPDANLVGVAAGAPASELKLLGSALKTSPFFGYLFMAAAGFKASYPELDLSAVFTPEGLAAVEAAGQQCGSETIDAVAGDAPTQYLIADPGVTEPFASLLEENSPGVRGTTVPIFMYHGEADEQIPVIASQLVLDRYCAKGTTASRKTWPGESHGSVVARALPDIEQYLADRLAGVPAPSSCP